MTIQNSYFQYGSLLNCFRNRTCKLILMMNSTLGLDLFTKAFMSADVDFEKLSLIDDERVSEFVSLAIQHGMIGLMVSKLQGQLEYQSNYSCSQFENLFVDQLFVYHKNYIIKQSFIDVEVSEVLSGLHQLGVKVVALKGFSLGYGVYPSSDLRPRSDVDLLIDAKDSEQVKAFLSARGYYNPRGWQPKAILNQYSQRKKIAAGINADFDIHLKLFNDNNLQNSFTYKEILQDAEFYQKFNVYFISKHHAFIHAAIHLLHHRVQGDVVKIIWYYDLYLLAKSFSADDLVKLYEAANCFGLAGLIIAACQGCKEFFPADEIDLVISQLKFAGKNPKLNYFLEPANHLQGFKREFLAARGLKRKWLLIQEIFFPPAAEIYAKYGHDTKVPLLFLYLSRIIHGIIRVFLKNKD